MIEIAGSPTFHQAITDPTTLTVMDMFLGGILAIVSAIFWSSSKTASSTKERIAAIEKDNDGFKKDIIKIIDRIQDVQSRQQELFDEILPLVRDNKNRLVREAKDNIRRRGVESWQNGYNAIRDLIVSTYEKYSDSPHEYASFIHEAGISKLKEEQEITISELGGGGAKICDSISEKVFSPFMAEIKDFIISLCEDGKLRKNWSLTLKSIFVTYMKEWSTLFGILYDED